MSEAKPLGAVLAGGRSLRFGSDKALALLAGRPLLAHVVEALRPQCAEVVVVGRSWPGLRSLADWPGPGLGPLGGLCGALRGARQLGHPSVLAAPCDMPGLPADLVERLAPAPAVAEGHWTVGLWPAALASSLEAWLAASRPRALRAFAEAVGARAVPIEGLRNVNRPDDLSDVANGSPQVPGQRHDADTQLR